MSNQEKIKTETYTIIKKIINDPSIDINDKSDFSIDLGIKSFQALELIAEVESALKVKIPDESMENIKTVGDLIREIQSQ